MTRDNRNTRRAGAIAVAIVTSILLAACQTSPERPSARRGPLIVAPATCSDFSVPIYFEHRSAKLSRDAKALVEAAVRQARGCQVTKISVLGLTDAAGDPDRNLALSEHRAAAVTRALARRGLTSVEFQVSAEGAQGAQTSSGLSKPDRRRAEVTFHLAAPPPTSTSPPPSTR